MRYKAKISRQVLLACFVAMPLLASCGLRGSPRPAPPIFKKSAQEVKPPTVQAPVVQAPAEPRQSTTVRENVNEFGGEIPNSAPTGLIGSTPLDDPIVPEDPDEEEV